MEKKIKHRLLGFFVIIAAIVIAMPLFHGENPIPQEITIVKAPPFPDQAEQIPAQVVEQNKLAEDTQSHLIPVSEATAKIKEEETSVKLAEDLSLKSDVVKDAGQKEANNRGKISTLSVADKKLSKVTEKKLVTANKSKTKILRGNIFDANGLSKLKDPAWVIQVGSFKDKAEAIRLVNRLRSNGYPAFLQHIDTVVGDNTRVFVGPERKQKEARAVASRLETELHIQSIVISYKPLTL